MGDSYASGVGAGNSLQTFSLCYRYSNAYAEQLQRKDFPNLKLNFPACAGRLFPQIRAQQLGDDWGKAPGFVTISMGGNDIGFKELVTKCIYGINLFAGRTPCQTLIDRSRAKLESGQIEQGAVDTLNAIMKKARDQKLANEFKIYVLGYARFFNDQTTQCNNVRGLRVPRFLRLSKPELLTVDLRKQLNDLAVKLNLALLAATKRATNPGQIVWTPIDDLFNTHRFCDRDEPNPNDPQTWFFTFYADDVAPTGSTPAASGKSRLAKRLPGPGPAPPPIPHVDDPAADPKAEDPPPTVGDIKAEAFLRSIPKIKAILDDTVEEGVSEDEFIKLVLDAANKEPDKEVQGVNNVKVFHPRSIGHQAIAARIREKISDPDVTVRLYGDKAKGS